VSELEKKWTAPSKRPVPKDAIRVVDGISVVDVPRKSATGRRLEFMTPKGTDVVNLTGNESFQRSIPAGGWQPRCRCGHVVGAHDGIHGPCTAKLCRKNGMCAKFREEA